MYIPTTFFSANGSTIVASGGTQGTFFSSSQLYGYNLFTTPGTASFIVSSGSVQNARLVIIGGGGGGMEGFDGTSADLAAGGGGAGGVYIDDKITIAPRTYSIVVGAGGGQGNTSFNPSVITAPTNGGSSSFSYPLYSTIGFGGGYGGYGGELSALDTSVRLLGGTGASGGGNAQFVNGNFINPSTAIQGNSGGFISQSVLGTATAYTATGGGGAGSGSQGITDAMADSGIGATAGGIGLQIPIYPINGNTASYFAGGGGAFGPGGSGGAGGSNKVQPGGSGSETYGGGGNAGGSNSGRNAQDGRGGLVYIEYPLYPVYYPNTMVSGGLTLWTSFNSLTGSSWYDISGNGNSGYVTGSAITVSNNSVPFNGINNMVWFTSSLNATPSSSMTLIWNGTFASSSINYDLFCKESFANGWDTIFSYPLNKIIFRDNGGQDVEASAIYQSIQKTVFAMTITNGSQKIYRNGVEVSTGTSGFNGFTSSNFPLVFGFNENTDASWFSGSMSDVLVYNRILNSSEILSVSNYLTQNVTRPSFTPVEPPIPSNGINIDYLLVGGGGGSAQYTGGGAGGYVSSSASFIFDSSSLYFDIVVGKSGSVTTDTQPTNGGNSSISSSLLFNSASGGGAGAYMNTINFFPQADGQVGGSGGGGLIRNIYTLSPGAGISPQGFSGGSAAGAQPASGAGGGGAGAAGNNQNGGIGKLWVDGVYYAGGGYGNFRIGGNGTAGSGSIGRGGSAGGVVPNDGVVKVRYLGSQRGSGGTITQSGGYTYHTFTSNGTLRLDRF